MSAYRVEERSGRVCFILPWRRSIHVAKDVRSQAGCSFTVAVFGAFMTLFAGATIQRGLEGAGDVGPVGVLFALPFAILGIFLVWTFVWYLFGARTVIELRPDRLILRECQGPLVFRRSVRTSTISGFRVESSSTTVGALEIDLLNGGKRRWAVDHALPLLHELAADLARRHDGLGVREEHPGDVQHRPDGVRITMRPLGWRTKERFVLSILAVAAYFLTFDPGAQAVWYLSVPGIAFLAFLGACLAFRVRRVYVYELTDKLLRVSWSDGLRRSRQEWPTAGIRSYQVGPRNRGEDSPWELRAIRSKGDDLKLLANRDREELEWLASVLKRGFRPNPVVVVAQATAVGTCQVCGDSMADRVVWCRRCRTPHHRECWEYMGMCSTFGCREIGFSEKP